MGWTEYWLGSWTIGVVLAFQGDAWTNSGKAMVLHTLDNGQDEKGMANRTVNV